MKPGVIFGALRPMPNQPFDMMECPRRNRYLIRGAIQIMRKALPKIKVWKDDSGQVMIGLNHGDAETHADIVNMHRDNVATRFYWRHVSK